MPALPAVAEPLAKGREQSLYEAPALETAPAPALRRDLRVVTPSKWLCDRLTRQELSRFETRIIPYGIDLDRFKPISDARQQLRLPSDVPIVFHVAAPEGKGRYSHRKGLVYVAEAFETYVVPRLPGAILVIGGEDVVPNRPWVRPVGKIPQSDLPKWMSAADVFVNATLADNLPYTVLEAMGCGRPVIGSAIGGLAEMVVHGETGLLVPPRNAAALGDALVALLLDPDRRRAYGTAGRARAETNFDMSDFVAAYESLFEEMIAARSTRMPPTVQSKTSTTGGLAARGSAPLR